MTCKACHGIEGQENRINWGCDHPAPVALLEVDCWACGGEFEVCRICDGKGTVEVDRCPHALIRPEHCEICTYASLLEVGVLPVSGGFADQSSTFVDAVMWVASIKAKLEQEKWERENA